jgi:hypothetical protein
MSPVDTARIPNIIQFNNESDAMPRIQTSTTIKSTLYTQNATRKLATYSNFFIKSTIHVKIGFFFYSSDINTITETTEWRGHCFHSIGRYRSIYWIMCCNFLPLSTMETS